MSTNLQVVSLFISILVFVQISHDGHIKGSLTREDDSEVVNIGGLFSLHCEKKMNRSARCGKFRLDGYEEFNAMLFAVTKINENRSLLPGITLQVKFKDTCSSVELATNRSLSYTITKYRSKHGCSTKYSREDLPVLAIVGERDSDISRAVTNLVGLFHIPVISYGSTSSSLNGVKYFLRTVPPDTFTVQAIVDILRKFQWNYIILLYSDSEYGRFAADDFRSRLRKQRTKICIAVDEELNAGHPEEQRQTWEKIQKEKRKTKIVVVMASYEDFNYFLKTGKERYNLKEYIWLSDSIWNGQTGNITSMLGYAISVIPFQVHIQEFADFFHNVSTQPELDFLTSFASFEKEWFKEYQSLPQDMRSPTSSKNTCLTWRSSQVSFVMDAVYSIACALHYALHCGNGSTNCTTNGKQLVISDLLSRIKNVNFTNPWTKNHVAFTDHGNPRSVQYAVVSLRKTEFGNCFESIGHWKCFVQDSHSCKANLSLEKPPSNVSMSEFLGVCGVPCLPGEYKVVDTQFASCCWQCMKCTGNKYTKTPGSPVCTECDEDEWPNDNHTVCLKVKPGKLSIGHPASIIILGVDALGLVLLFVLLVLFIRFRHSRMKIFSDPFMCYILLFGIAITYACSIVVLTDNMKEHCLLLIFLSKIGPTCTTATLFIKTNDVYRTYKRKTLKENPRFLSQKLKVFVVFSLVIIDVILTWLSLHFASENRKTSKIVYFHTGRGNTAYRQCGYLLYIFSRDIFTSLEVSYYWGLLLICTHQAYLTRKITDKSHGLRYVFFGSFAALFNSVLTLLAYYFTDSRGNNKELIFSVHHTFFATVAFACIFVPKMDIFVCHPEKDALFDALSTSVTSNMDSVFRLSRRKKSIEDFSIAAPAPET